MKRVENTEFLHILAELLKTAETEGSVYLEQKRLTRTGPDSVLDAVNKPPYPLIFRVTDGVRDKKRRKAVSTVVQSGDLEEFWNGYSEALKKGTGGLRRKEKKKQRK